MTPSPTAAHATHHLLRRTARKTATAYNVGNPQTIYRAEVKRADRGPYRYRVVLVLKKPRRRPVD